MFGMAKKEESETNQEEKSGPWGDKLNEALADARKSGVSGKKKSSAKPENGREANSGTGLSQQAEEQARKMFEPEAWRAIVRAPFSLGKAVTGRECWDLEKKQEDTLATSTSATAEYFLQTDPKWVALTLFMFNWSVILTEKFAMNARERMKEEALHPQQQEPTVGPVLVK